VGVEGGWLDLVEVIFCPAEDGEQPNFWLKLCNQVQVQMRG